MARYELPKMLGKSAERATAPAFIGDPDDLKAVVRANVNAGRLRMPFWPLVLIYGRAARWSRARPGGQGQLERTGARFGPYLFARPQGPEVQPRGSAR